MALSILANYKDPIKIESLTFGNLEVEVTLTEGYEFSNTITSYPIEDGIDITDMVKPTPYVYRLTGVTSNTPIEYFANGGLVRENLTNRAQVAFNTLLNMAGYSVPLKGKSTPKKAKPQLLTLITGLLVLKDMVITNISISRDKTTGESLPYAIDFKYIEKVKAVYKTESILPVNNAEKQAPNKVNKGKITGQQLPDKAQPSLLERAVRKIESYF